KEYQHKVSANQPWESHCGMLAAKKLQAPWTAYRVPRVEDLSLEDAALFLLVVDSEHILGDSEEIFAGRADAVLRVLDLAIEHQLKRGDVAAAGLVYRTLRSCY